MSDRTIVSDYFSYRIDRVDTLALRSGVKGCDNNCLTDEVEKNDELIRTMRRGLRIKVEFDAAPDITQQPTFSLRGFSRAYQWLLAD
jgi:invasion protein IalB